MKRKFESPSSIQMYRRCPQQYAFKYRDNLPWPPSDAMELGSVFGEAVYATWHLGEAIRIPCQGISAEDEAKIPYMLKALYNHPKIKELPKMKLIHGKTCEKKVICSVGGKSSVGYIDIVIPDVAPIDIKTSARKWDAGRVKESIQHLDYTYALRKEGMHFDKFIYIVVTTGKNPFVQFIEVDITDEALQKFEDEFVDTVEQIELDLFMPTPDSHCNWCPYRKVCPAYQ